MSGTDPLTVGKEVQDQLGPQRRIVIDQVLEVEEQVDRLWPWDLVVGLENRLCKSPSAVTLKCHHEHA
jgi:hypothetical protein